MITAASTLESEDTFKREALKSIEQLPASEYHRRFRASAARHSASVHQLANGTCVARIGPADGKRIWLLSGLHGDERSGPVALLNWLETSSPGKLVPGAFEVWIAPLVNDMGWDENTREWVALNLNRAFLPDIAPPFLKQLMDELANHVPSLYLDLHEDSTHDFAYVYRYTADQHDLVLQLQQVLGASDMPWSPAELTRWRGSSEVYVRRLGCDRAATLEVPPIWPLTHRVDWYLRAIRFCLGALPTISPTIEVELERQYKH